MPTGFHDVRLPDDVERGAKGGPSFKTTVLGAISGVEQRNMDWERARHRWNIGYGMESRDNFMSVVNFFYARRGRAFGFRFKDWTDYTSGSGFSLESADPDNRSFLGAGTGAIDEFQLVKHYEDDVSSYTRTITRPVEGTVRVWVDSVEQTETTDWTLDYSTGLITFVVPPPLDDAVEAFFQFDVPVRFNEDSIEVELEWWNAGQIPDIPIIEVKE